jgi:predicted phosphodiesterase
VRYLVLTDIHANLEAFDAVLATQTASTCDHILVLGDLVGYGADPNAVVERVRSLPAFTAIRGNHDKAAAALSESVSFNHLARAAIEWTARTLTVENRAYVAALPPGPTIVDNLTEICHGTTFDEDVYVFDELDAIRSLRGARRPLCLFGHTHVPAGFQRLDDSLLRIGPRHQRGRSIPFNQDEHWLVNFGAVGQPRDGDWRAAFGVVDTATRTFSFERTDYDVDTAKKKILAAGLPDLLAERLSVGR